ncbi:hypothetical protein KBY91_22680 [Streptomyces sp. RK23]|uniref:DUF6215 domain-containing protein n=1 Tax=unclassified Streptomyces TaxID=2593676 RepID=UPI001B3914F3|nr:MULTISPECIES: DUF6215 domain-containing protein [unclassified Streptomyces]MBQ0964982.1 hypothetical protein [Streptomyces sp. RK74B]MBQ1006212.1 hypothetical protein [Streptomyces sp. RK23]
MLGFLVRLLPFWVREPLLILVGSVFGVRIMYLAHRDGEWVAAAIGLVFLVFTAVRVHTVARALRARRAPVPAAAVAPAPQTPLTSPTAPAAPAVAVAAQKEPNAWGQAVAAVAVFAALGAALWLGPHLLPSDDDGAPRAASCAGGKDEELPGAYRKTPRAVTGDELCNALNRPDLAQLLGTPAETATAVSGSSGTAPLTDGKVAQPEAEVQFDTYTVNVSVTYNELSIAQYVKLMEYGEETDVKTLSVLGRPAVLASDHTMKIEINFGGGSGGPVEQGPPARTLSVALDAKDRGGYYDITVWSTSGALPDDGALLDIAEKVLPTIPERTV